MYERTEILGLAGGVVIVKEKLNLTTQIPCPPKKSQLCTFMLWTFSSFTKTISLLFDVTMSGHGHTRLVLINTGASLLAHVVSRVQIMTQGTYGQAQSDAGVKLEVATSKCCLHRWAR
ncbi:hypothetical protein ACJX0J_011473, partial [Zea mays]